MITLGGEPIRSCSQRPFDERKTIDVLFLVALWRLLFSVLAIFGWHVGSPLRLMAIAFLLYGLA